MPARKYTDEQIEWLRNNSWHRFWKDVTPEFNAFFGTNYSEKQIKLCAMNWHIYNGLNPGMRKGVERPDKRLLQPEEMEIFAANNPGKTAKEMVIFCRDKFKKNFTPEQIKGIRARAHLISGLTGQFKKGNIPQNKGEKVSPEVYEKIKGTMFKKGNRPKNTNKIGDERVTKDGYHQVKIFEDRGHRNWVQKSRLIWDKEHPEDLLKEDEIIIFLDNNKDNLDISNLVKITREEHSMINHIYSHVRNEELRKLVIATVKVKRMIKKNES